MKHTHHLFLVLSIPLIKSALVKSTSPNQNTENSIGGDPSYKNVTIPDNNAIGEVFIPTIEPGLTKKTTSGYIEDAETSEDTNSVQAVDSGGPKNRSREIIVPFASNKSRIYGIDDNPNFTRGYFGGYYFLGTDNTHYFCHGKYQRPTLNYYGNYNHTLEDRSPLGYYLGYAMNKMDHNEYFRHNNFTHFNIHHYFYMNSTMLPERDIGSDHLVFCAPNTSTFCPENTEAICLLNTTVWCGTKVSFVQPCAENEVKKNCVNTRVPCVKSDDANCQHLLEALKLPCISRIKILDVDEDKNGLTFNNVAETFILAPVPLVSERTYCITIVAEPTRNHVKL